MERAMFSISDAISFAFQNTRKYLGLWLGVWLTQLGVLLSLYLLMYANMAYFTRFLLPQLGITTLFHQKIVEISINVVIGIALLASMMLLRLGIIRMALDIYDRQTTSYGQLFMAPWSMVAQGVITLWFLIAFIAGGSVFLVIPGIVAAVLFVFSLFILVDKHLGIINSLVLSSRLSAKAFSKVLMVVVLVIITNGIFNVLITLPLVWLITTFKLNFFINFTDLQWRALYQGVSWFIAAATIPLIHPFLILLETYVYRQLVKDINE